MRAGSAQRFLKDTRHLWPAAALAALTGLRSMPPLALVSRRVAGGRIRAPGALGPLAALAHPAVARALTLAAIGEAIADKTPLVPARTRPLPLAGRLLAGAVAAAGATGMAGMAVVGALGALAGTFAGYHLRRIGARRLGRDWPVALAEDALCLLAARALLARMG
jgi:uncharacterized membrane protein